MVCEHCWYNAYDYILWLISLLWILLGGLGAIVAIVIEPLNCLQKVTTFEILGHPPRPYEALPHWDGSRAQAKRGHTYCMCLHSACCIIFRYCRPSWGIWWFHDYLTPMTSQLVHWVVHFNGRSPRRRSAGPIVNTVSILYPTLHTGFGSFCCVFNATHTQQNNSAHFALCLCMNRSWGEQILR